MAPAKKGDTVKVHYVGKLADGRLVDTSFGREPLQFTIGKGNVFPDFEQAIVGMEPGTTKRAVIQAHKAYGNYNENMIKVVDRKKFPSYVKPEAGQQIKVFSQGQPVVATVLDVSTSEVVLDTNHPLAGHDLLFDIRLVEIVSRFEKEVEEPVENKTV
jgi:FKBP-type peptidyl-prolyl cis-trans isomerase 2